MFSSSNSSSSPSIIHYIGFRARSLILYVRCCPCVFFFASVGFASPCPSALPRHTLLCPALPCPALRCSALPYSALAWLALPCLCVCLLLPLFLLVVCLLSCLCLLACWLCFGMCLLVCAVVNCAFRSPVQAAPHRVCNTCYMRN